MTVIDVLDRRQKGRSERLLVKGGIYISREGRDIGYNRELRFGGVYEKEQDLYEKRRGLKVSRESGVEESSKGSKGSDSVHENDTRKSVVGDGNNSSGQNENGNRMSERGEPTLHVIPYIYEDILPF